MLRFSPCGGDPGVEEEDEETREPSGSNSRATSMANALWCSFLMYGTGSDWGDFKFEVMN